MTEQAHDTLREQVNRAVEPSLAAAHYYGTNVEQRDAATERVLAVFAGCDDAAYRAGKETSRRILRERIEALRSMDIGHGVSDIAWREAIDAVLGVFDDES